MIDSLKMGKRAITVAVAAATILWSVGISSFVAPLTARAASPGDLIKGTTLSTVYYYGSDGTRYAFPNEKSYFTWYADFSSVVTMSDSELAAIPLTGNIVYRPGTRWIKIQSDAKTYVVSPQGQIRWVESEAVAMDLAGSDWNTMIDDVPDTFFVDYTVGTSLTDASDAYNGALVEMGGVNYLVWDGEKREVSSAGFSANMFQSRNVLDGDGMDLAGLTAGSDLTSEESALTDSSQMGGVDQVTGGLSVSLASDTPASATIPSSAASVPFTKVKLMASSGTAEVSSMVFELGGIGATANIENAYLYEGSVRLTDARSVNSSTRSTTFSGLSISLNSGESTYLTVRADIPAAATVTSGDTAYFYLTDASAVTSTATVSGSFPISGNTMTFSDTAAGTLTVTAGTDPSNPTIGEEAAEIAELDLEAASEDGLLQELTVKIDDAADHSNYQLWHGDDLLAAGTVSNKLVTFVLTDPLLIEEGDSEDVQVTADIGGESADTILVSVEAEADVMAIGSDYGFNMSVDITGYDEDGAACAASTDDCSRSTIEGGELTFAFNGPSADDIVVDGKDEVLMEFSITSANWTEVQEIDVIFEDDSEDDDDDDNTGLKQTDEELNLQDLALRKEDGSAWMGPEELSGADSASDATQTISFTDDQIMQAGEQIDLMVTADLDTAVPAGEIYHVELDMSGTEAEDANGDALSTSTDIVPSADIIGNNMTVTDSSLTATLSQPPSSGTFVRGATDVSVVAFQFEAGNASDVTVNEAVFTVAGDDDGTWSDETDVIEDDFISSCSVYDSESGSLVDGPESPDGGSATADATMTFENMDWTIEAGESSKLILKCNFSNQNASSSNDAYVFYIEQASNIEAEDAEGDTVTVGTIADADGNDPTGSETVVITVSTGGSMTVTASGSTANSTIVLGASTDVPVSAFKFAAVSQAFVIETFTLQNCVNWNADGDTSDCTGSGETAGQDDVVAAVYIDYTDSTGTAASDVGFLSNNLVTFDNLDLYVPADGNTTVTVSVDTNSVSASGGATSGDQFQLNFDDVNFDADGVGSSTSLTASSTGIDDVSGVNEMTLRKTKPTFSLASGSPASGGGVAGLNEVFRFNVAADSRGYVTLNQVVFKVSTAAASTGWEQCDGGSDIGSATKWEVYDYEDSSDKLDDSSDWSFLESDGSTCDGSSSGDVLEYALWDLEGSTTHPAEEIGAGETKTYVVRIDTSGASASNDDSIRIDIPDEAETAALTTARDAIQWEDDSATTEIDGTLIKNLPVTGGNIQY